MPPFFNNKRGNSFRLHILRHLYQSRIKEIRKDGESGEGIQVKELIKKGERNKTRCFRCSTKRYVLEGRTRPPEANASDARSKPDVCQTMPSLAEKIISHP